jgi:hypothetical protein
MSRKRANDFARDLIECALSDDGLIEFGQYPLFLAVQRAFVGSQGMPQGRPEVRAIAEDALWRAMSDW